MDDFAAKLAAIRETGANLAYDAACAALHELAATVKSPLRLFEIAEAFHDMGFVAATERYATLALRRCTDEHAPEHLLVKKYALELLCAVCAEIADHTRASKISRELLALFPKDQEILISGLRHMSYDPSTSPRDLRTMAEYWAHTVQRPHAPRPKAYPHTPLRIGYVSGDFTPHPVGLLLRGVLAWHDRERFALYTYNAKQRANDIVEPFVRKTTTMRDVESATDDELEARIRDDEIDILVDLSGFTSYTRLAVFAREPAPVLVSWLGYWGTTGLACMDGVLLDALHAPIGTEEDFTEPILRLPKIRFCYQPLSEEPGIEDPPCTTTDTVTFGCCNSTYKLNAHLIDVWARVLSEVPTSRLLLKWRTFNDPLLRERLTRAFQRRGIAGERIVYEGWSNVASALATYKSIDIALDPFPFPGGMTTCDTLWMGVPVVTLPKDSVISRQGAAILTSLGLEELIAKDEDHYVAIATGLAKQPKLLTLLRHDLRARMLASPLCDVISLTRNLEACYLACYKARCAS